MIAQKTLMQENWEKNLIVWFRYKWLWLKTYDQRFCTMGKLNDLHHTWNTAGREGKKYSSVLADNCWCTNQLVALQAGVLNLIAFIKRPRCWRTFSVGNNGSVWTDDNYANKFFSKYFKLEGRDYFTKIFQDKANKTKMRNTHPRNFLLSYFVGIKVMAWVRNWFMLDLRLVLKANLSLG